jgi:hypothetical protein
MEESIRRWKENRTWSEIETVQCTKELIVSKDFLLGIVRNSILPVCRNSA